ncbi:MAG: TonB-dependent receptor, partial [Alphaproteobacteria bacterium]|nr:TonB-dependent receptor [Alphaproteobacteria bacterium]
ELEANLHEHNTNVNISGAYIDAKFINFTGAPCYPTQSVAQGCVADATGNFSQNLSGASLPDSPKLKLNASIEQTVPLNSFNLLLNGNLAYRTDTYLQADQNPQTFQPGFALLDASIGFQSKNKRTTLTLFVNNITDHFYLTDAEDFFSGAFGVVNPNGTYTGGPANVVVGQPARDAHRYFGARVEFKF